MVDNGLDADIVTSAVNVKFEMLDQNHYGQLAMPQGSSDLSGTADAIDRPEGDLVNQIQALFKKNTDTVNNIAKLNTVQTELVISKIENNLVTNMVKNNELNEMNSKKLNEIT